MANDHGAAELALRLKEHLEAKGFEVNHLGVTSTESVDYPDMAKAAVEEYRKGGYSAGVLLCGTGIGISLAANKMKGIRCALPQDSYAAAMAKEHNNANFIAFGGRIEYKEEPEKMLDAYLDAEFAGGRHQRRVDKIMDLEGK